MSTVHLVHGWGEDDGGRGSVGRLRPFIEDAGGNPDLHSHGWMPFPLSLIEQRFRTGAVSEDVAAKAKDGDCAVAYSNGGAVLVRSEAPLDTIVLIAPALPTDQVFPDAWGRIIVLYSGDDLATGAGAIWAHVNPVSWIAGHDWGAMGRYGYTGDDERVENWQGRDISHLDWFDDEPLSHWGPKIAEAVT